MPCRHAITKLSHLHFVAAEPFRARVDPDGRSARTRVHGRCAGPRQSWRSRRFRSARQWPSASGLQLDRPLFLITYHPATLGDTDPLAVSRGTARRARPIPGRRRSLFTKANADSGGRAINERLEAYVAQQSGHMRARRVAWPAILSRGAEGSRGRDRQFVKRHHRGAGAGTPTVNLGIRDRRAAALRKRHRLRRTIATRSRPRSAARLIRRWRENARRSDARLRTARECGGDDRRAAASSRSRRASW